MVYTYTTSKYVFNMSPGDVYWCTADCGWITGHSYLTYGPLLVGASQVVFEGVPTYPAADRCWQVVDKYQVKQFYTAPTAIRSLMRAGELFVKEHSRDSLRILGSVGEPINPEAWRWCVLGARVGIGWESSIPPSSRINHATKQHEHDTKTQTQLKLKLNTTLKHNNIGTTTSSATAAAPSWTPGGRPRRAAT